MIRIYILSSSSVFLSTPSARRATADAAIQSLGFQDFYPRPPRGGRPCMAALNDWLKGISIHALREEGDVQHHANVFDLAISIHALREEGDWHSATKGDASPHFYPRPPRGGRRATTMCRTGSGYFYPRPPRGGRRARRLESARTCTDFYPRPPRGGRPSASCSCGVLSVFLSTPSARRATGDFFHGVGVQRFLSTPSARRATGTAVLLHEAPDISIHALREEGDLVHSRSSQFQQISIHALREEGDINYVSQTGARIKFLSTPSARRATEVTESAKVDEQISIHTLREEGDRPAPHVLRGLRYFYPRPPRGGRRGGAVRAVGHLPISIHALREEGDDPKKHRQRQTV